MSSHDATHAALLHRIRTNHGALHGNSGATRVPAEQQAESVAGARKRVARLMREAGLRGVSRRRRSLT